MEQDDMNRRALLDDRKALIADMLEALDAIFDDYRTEGCPDPKCKVCVASKVAEVKARFIAAKARAHLST